MVLRCRVPGYLFTAAHAAVVGSSAEMLRTVLSSAPSLLDAPAGNGDTPLHTACIWSHKRAARLLVALGGQLNVMNNQGQTPLDVANKRYRKQLTHLDRFPPALPDTTHHGLPWPTLAYPGLLYP